MKYLRKYNEVKKLHESNDFDIDKIDPYGEEDWDEVDGDVDEVDDEETVIDYYGNEIFIDDAVDIHGEYFSIDDARWSEYYNEYLSPEDNDVIWIDGRHGGDFLYKDDSRWSERYGEYFHPDDNSIVYINSVDDWVHEDDSVYSEREGEDLLGDGAQWCEYEIDYCLIDDSVKLGNGGYSFSENVKEDYKGDNYHEDTLEWDDDKNGYVYTG